jgi:hypothetical protein
MDQSYGFNVIGNILNGASVVQGSNVYPTSIPATIYSVGYYDVSQEIVDALIASTLEHANYAVSSMTYNESYNHTLPSSLYLTSKPSFFSTKDWPCYSPTDPTNGTLPAEDRFIAEVYI